MSTALKVMPASTQQQQKGSSIVLDVGKPKTGVARNQSGVAARAVNVNNVNNVNGIATANPNAAGVGGATATLNKAAGVPFQTVIAKSEQK